jgi:hypothetical protein
MVLSFDAELHNLLNIMVVPDSEETLLKQLLQPSSIIQTHTHFEFIPTE